MKKVYNYLFASFVSGCVAAVVALLLKHYTAFPDFFIGIIFGSILTGLSNSLK